jgi:hypothetical protein
VKNLAFALILLSVPAAAQPVMPKLKDVMAGSLTDRAKIRWSKVVEGNRVELTIGGGVAERLNPNMSSEAARLKYDLPRNRELERQVKATKLGSQSRFATSDATDRTLEILGEGPSGYVVLGRWSMPLKSWKKKNSGLVELLEPLFDVQQDVFQPTKGPER